MDVRIEILAKTESQSMNDPSKSNYVVTMKLEIEGEQVMFQGQQFLPSVNLDDSMWAELYVGQLLDGELT